MAEFLGKTVEEAIELGLKTLGLEKENAEITVLEEPVKGFLGIGGKKAKVEVSAKKTDGERASAFITGLFDLMDVNAKCNLTEEGEKIISKIVLRLEANNKATTEFLEQDLQTEFPLSAFNIDFDFENIEKMKSEIELSSLRDWNYRTIKDTVELFEKITNYKISEVQNPKKFWKYLLRGGIQGALYFYDSNLDGVISNNEE